MWLVMFVVFYGVRNASGVVQVYHRDDGNKVIVCEVPKTMAGDTSTAPELQRCIDQGNMLCPNMGKLNREWSFKNNFSVFSATCRAGDGQGI